MISKFSVKTAKKTQLVNVTSIVREAVDSSGVQEGLCTVYVPHTTAGITINEAADPAVAKDILFEIDKIVPFDDRYSHSEGNSAAHIKASLVGSSCQIPVTKGNLGLGTWQGIFFCEFDGARNRTVDVCVLGN